MYEATIYVDGIYEKNYTFDSTGSILESQELSHMAVGDCKLHSYRTGDLMGDLTPADKWTMQDALGSVSCTTDGSGAILSVECYYAFGETAFGSYAKKRYRYCGKERDSETGLYYCGARYYDAWTCRFVSVDPLADEYTGWSPYCYALNNPLKYNDPSGMEAADPSTEVKKNVNGTYTVVGAKVDGDRNIYVVNDKGERQGSIGKSLTEYSFIYDDGKPVVGAIIDPKDGSGIKFMNDKIVKADHDVWSYMFQATGFKPLDFKTNNIQNRPTDVTDNQYKYRGMPFEGIEGFGNQDGPVTTYASARDIGNVGAGFVAGNNGYTWAQTRIACDWLESFQQGKSATEGKPTQEAQLVGHKAGLQLQAQREQRAIEKKFQKATQAIPFGPKY